LLICENAEQFNGMVYHSSATADECDANDQRAFTQAKANLLSEGSIGQPLISNYAPTLAHPIPFPIIASGYTKPLAFSI
jgi:hypothetical protein